VRLITTPLSRGWRGRIATERTEPVQSGVARRGTKRREINSRLALRRLDSARKDNGERLGLRRVSARKTMLRRRNARARNRLWKASDHAPGDSKSAQSTATWRNPGHNAGNAELHRGSRNDSGLISAPPSHPAVHRIAVTRTAAKRRRDIVYDASDTREQRARVPLTIYIYTSRTRENGISTMQTREWCKAEWKRFLCVAILFTDLWVNIPDSAWK